MPVGRLVLADQAAALARVEDLVDAEQLWRTDRRAVTLAVLRGLVHGMSWESGLIAGVTRAHLAAAAGCSVRTVSRVVAWAVEVELVVVVETGATAEFLGTEHNRAPSYVLTTPAVDPPDVPLRRLVHGVGGEAVDALGNPPACGGWESSPRRERGRTDRQDQKCEPWRLWEPALDPRSRARAVDRLLERTGLSARVVRWRAVAMLAPWFDDGWCVAGLLWALDHHPDRPDAARGDATRSARDPLRVLGHRLAPWRGRGAEVPSALQAVSGQAVMAGHGRPPVERPRVAGSTPAVRAAAMAEVTRALARPTGWSRERRAQWGRS